MTGVRGEHDDTGVNGCGDSDVSAAKDRCLRPWRSSLDIQEGRRKHRVEDCSLHVEEVRQQAPRPQPDVLVSGIDRRFGRGTPCVSGEPEHVPDAEPAQGLVYPPISQKLFRHADNGEREVA